MFKIIKISDFDRLTVDSTLITVDNDIITVDATSGGDYEFSVPYRFFSEEVKFIIYDELNDIEYILQPTAQDLNNYMVFNFQFDFEAEKTYESRITDLNDKLIWRGKIFATEQDDLQNYSISKNEREV